MLALAMVGCFSMEEWSGDEWGTLSDDDIVAVLSYIKSQWPDKVIQIHNEQINQ